MLCEYGFLLHQNISKGLRKELNNFLIYKKEKSGIVIQLMEKPQSVDMGSCTTVTSFTSLLIISPEGLNKTQLEIGSDLLVLISASAVLFYI